MVANCILGVPLSPAHALRLARNETYGEYFLKVKNRRQISSPFLEDKKRGQHNEQKSYRVVPLDVVAQIEDGEN